MFEDLINVDQNVIKALAKDFHEKLMALKTVVWNPAGNFEHVKIWEDIVPIYMRDLTIVPNVGSGLFTDDLDRKWLFKTARKQNSAVILKNNLGKNLSVDENQRLDFGFDFLIVVSWQSHVVKIWDKLTINEITRPNGPQWLLPARNTETVAFNF